MKVYNNKSNYQVSIIEGQRFNSLPVTIMPYGKGWQYNTDIVMEEEKFPNGTKNIVYYATSYRISKKMELNDIINAFIRCFYTVDYEFAIQRQRDTKPEKFEKYNETVNKIIIISEELYKKF